MFHFSHWRRPVIILLLLLTFFLRVYHLNAQSLRGDEAATVLYSAMPVSELWELSRVTDPHPPLYYLMLHPWQWLLGEDGWVMRFAGVIASTLAVPVLYTLAQRTLRSTNIGLLASALLAINPFQIWLAQDVRSYPFFTLFGLLSSWALWSVLHKTTTPTNRQSTKYEASRIIHHSSFIIHHSSHWLLYILLTVVCLYIHYYAVFLIAFQGIFVLLNIKQFRGKLWPWVASQIAIGLLIIPGLKLAYNFIGQAAGGIDKTPTSDILRLASTALLTGFTIDNTWGLWVSLLLIPVWGIGLVTLLRRNFASGVFWPLFFALPVLGVIALSIDRPFFKERFLVQAQPAFELLLAVGFLTLWQTAKKSALHPTPHWSFVIGHWSFANDEGQMTSDKPNDNAVTNNFGCGFAALRITTTLLLIALLSANALALSNYFTNSDYAKAPPWHLYHDYVSQKAGPNDVMLTNFPEAAVSYYSPNGLPFYVVPVERDRSLEFRLEQTEQIANAYERIWFLPLLRQGFDEQGDVLKWLDRHADRVNQVFFPVYHLNLYLSPATIDTLLIGQPAIFAHGLRLRGYQIFDQAGKSRLTPSEGIGTFLLSAEPENEFTLSLYWQADGPTDVPYTVFTHLIAADGFNQAGQDNQPVWGSYPTTNWSPGEKITDKFTLTIPPGTPFGDYRLRVGWYQPDTLERVPVLDNAGQPVADHVILDIIVRVE